MSNATLNQAISSLPPGNSKFFKPFTLLLKISCMIAICSLPLHAGAINPEKKKRSLSRQKPKIARHNVGKHLKAEVCSQWPGQGDPKVEKTRKCIRYRESKGNYRIADKRGRWFGAYQFNIITSNTAAKRMRRPDLVGVPANKWTVSEQDAAFYVIYNLGKGKSHFYHPSSRCF